jgi:hypothetical protein
MGFLSVGALVTHPEHGVGRVVSLLRGGRAAMVRFDRIGALEIHVSVRELISPPGPSGPPTADPSTPSTTGRSRPDTRPAPKADARPPSAPSSVAAGNGQLLEALRLGVVPADGLDLYTVGREAEVRAVDADLAAVKRGEGAARIILGDYGTGKTHLLEHVAARARAQGFLVAQASLDPVDAPASNPRRVYRVLMQGLTYPDLDAGVGLTPLLDRARGHEAVKARFLGEERHAYLTPAVSLWNRLDESQAEPVLDWLSGAAQDYTPELNARYRLYGKRSLPALMDYRPWAHIYAYLLSGLAALAHATGHAGLVVLLDEAEFFRVLTAENREFAERLFRALVAAALPAGELPFSPDDEPRGGRGELKTLAHRYTGHCPLYVMMAMTPTGQGDTLVESLVRPERRLELTPLGAPEYRELARRVVLLYADRHEVLRPKVDALSQLIGDLMFKGLADGSFDTPRMAVKFVLELLDMSRTTPDRVRTALEELKRLWY